MEVKESEWVSTAIKKIDNYLNRGGPLQGDVPQYLGGTDLLNTIGEPMGLPKQNPQEWNKDEEKKALNGNFVFYKEKAREAIDVVVEQIRYCCNGVDSLFITVIPIELYYEGKLYELPVYRVHHHKNSKKYYVDNTGRSYDSVNDWYDHNKLPPGKMAYPYNLQLMLKPGYNYSRVLVDDTPSARVGPQIVKGVDIAATVAGIGSSVGLIFVTGGLVAPLILTGVASAFWGTGRAGYQIINKASHGENVNPLNNSENRSLWLGIAANIVSFGAMGASMRLTSLAVRGRDISNSTRILINTMNGTNVVISGFAVIDASLNLIEHYDELSHADILMHVASIAFWTKGVYKYKTAGAMIKSVQDHTFKVISNELSPDAAQKLSIVRKQFNNDSQLIREYHKAAKAKISVQSFSQIVIDTTPTGEKIQFDNSGNLLLRGGYKYSITSLSKLSQNDRTQYFDIIYNLKRNQVELLESLRQRVNNDTSFITSLSKFAAHYHLSLGEATEYLLNFWEKCSKTNMSTAPKITINEGRLVLGKAPPLNLSRLRGLSDSMVRFVSEHLSHMDDITSQKWSTSLPVLEQLERRGMFSKCQVTEIVPTGRAVFLLNKNLQISIYKLREIDSEDCNDMLRLIGQLPATVSSTQIPKNTMPFVGKYRLRLECHRRESVDWMTVNVNEKLLPILKSGLQNFEKDRLFTFNSTVTTAKATPYMKKMMNFVSDMNPKNVSEMVSYGEYVVNYVEAEKRNLEGDLRSGRLKLPANTKKADFLRQKASETAFNNPTAMQQKWNSTVDLVRTNSMVGPASVKSELSDESLIMAIHRVRIGFGSEASAAYHVLKHPTDPPSAYVQRANQVIRSATRYDVTLTQDGDARLLRFEDPQGSAILLERDGRVLLCTFSPKAAKP